MVRAARDQRWHGQNVEQDAAERRRVPRAERHVHLRGAGAVRRPRHQGRGGGVAVQQRGFQSAHVEDFDRPHGVRRTNRCRRLGNW